MAIAETTDWDALRLLRMGGKKPALPVIVTTKPHLPRRLEGVGCLVILHKAGEVMPVQLLEGLEVIFMFERCELATHVWRIAKAKGVKFNAKTWCKCCDMLSVYGASCASVAAAVDYFDAPRANAMGVV